jgi:uncharacterized damage-inducible protein DinB
MSENVESLVSRLESRVESHIEQAVKVFQNLDEATLNRPASNGGWSIAQCIQHLNTYGHFYLPVIKKGLDQNEKLRPSARFSSGWLGGYFTKMMEPKSQKKMKAFKNHIPAAQLDGHAVIAEFIEQQETILGLLQRSRSTNLNRIRLPISISKVVKLKLGDVLQFCVAHDARHIAQATRNIN